MHPDFAALVGALWADLGLGPEPPRRGTAGLTVDGQRVELAPTRDGRQVVVSARLAALSGDRLRAGDQMRSLLRDGAGLVLGHAAAVRLRPPPSGEGPRVVAVEAVAPCRPAAVPDLRRAIEDVLLLADVHRPTLSPAGSRGGSPPPRPAEPDDHLIFRL